MPPAPGGVNCLPCEYLWQFDGAAPRALWWAQHIEEQGLSRLDDACARLDAALQRLEKALQEWEASARGGTEARDRQIATLVAELASMKKQRDALDDAAALAETRIEAVIDRLRATPQN
jgi:chromosome segregation ATPase